jgi:colicin import membrane protein|tara:strand:+ start:327 stop:740 length:414 start_codon:yes stop_codon:yes gene_type:complete
MTDNLDEKNNQVKDDFIREITKIVKKNVSENSDLTEEQIIGIAIRVSRPTDQIPKYNPDQVLDSKFEGYSNYENSLRNLSHEKQKELDDLVRNPKSSKHDQKIAKQELTAVNSLRENYFSSMDIFRTSKGGRDKLRK